MNTLSKYQKQISNILLIVGVFSAIPYLNVFVMTTFIIIFAPEQLSFHDYFTVLIESISFHIVTIVIAIVLVVMSFILKSNRIHLESHN